MGMLSGHWHKGLSLHEYAEMVQEALPEEQKYAPEEESQNQQDTVSE
jgi:hypothetical protein